MPRPRRIPTSRLLSTLDPVPVKVQVSQPIEMRLEAMVVELMERARDLGDVTRGELVGTLIINRDVDDALVSELRRYRDSATVANAIDGGDAVTLRDRVRGRPVRRV